MKAWSSVVAVLLSLSCALVAQGASQIDVYHFDDAEQQRRYKALIEEFRCPKCLNTNIAGSDAVWRAITDPAERARLFGSVATFGYTDQEVRDFLQQRYGDFVLYNPPFNARTGLIWLMPIALVVLGVVVLFGLLRRARNRRALTLDSGDQARLQAILDKD